MNPIEPKYIVFQPGHGFLNHYEERPEKLVHTLDAMGASEASRQAWETVLGDQAVLYQFIPAPAYVHRLEQELLRIDDIMSRRPALDKASRWENIEHAINVAGRHDKIRPALEALLGAKTKQELDELEAGLRILSMPEKDRMDSINAIHALRETL